MAFRDLAEKLIAAQTNSERNLILKNVSEAEFLAVAFAIKEISYEFWTTEPLKTENGALVLEILAKRSSSPEISALENWIKGIAALTKGKLERAVKKLDESAAVFFQIDKEHEAAQTQVSKLYALALLGRYDQAIAVGKKALKIFGKFKDELASGKIEKNLGNIVSRRELHHEAENYYLAARKRFIKLKNRAELTMCEHGLAITYSALNDFHRAEKFYTSALSRAYASEMKVTQAEIETNIGNLALFRGRFDEALKYLESSRRKYENLKMPHQKVIAELEIADVYLELNLVGEAFEIYQRVTKTLTALKMQGEQARARANFGRVATTLKKEILARRELKKAAKLYLAEKNTVGAIAVKLSEAQLELSLKNFRKTIEIVCQTELLLKESGNLRYQLTSRWLQGEALRNLKEFDEAKKILKETFTAAARNEQANLAQAAQNSLGKLFVSQKQHRRAEKHFRRAIQMTEMLRAPLPAEEFRMAFLANKLEPFEELAKIYLLENKTEAAFALIESSRSRSLAESLGGNLHSQPATNGNSDKSLEKLISLREELNWFYSRLNRAQAEEIEALQREAQNREKQIAGLIRQIASSGTSANFQGTTEFDLAKLQTRLGADRVLIEYVILDEEISAFVVTDQKIRFVANLCAESVILPLLEGLQFQFGALRYGAKHLGAFLPELKKRADFYLAELYKKLLAPLENFTENRGLIIVPVGALHYVPFNALFDGQNYTIEKRAVSFAPSATVLQFCLSKPRQKFENALLVAHADERIPLATREIEQIRKLFRRAKTLTGDEASVSAFTKQAKDFDVVHLACHGEFRPDNPLFSRIYLADGAITVRDVCAQELNASLVTLSACETGLSSIFAGDEILGLARGFLTAGVSSLVLSLWTVNDEATAGLMNDFYTQLQTNGVSESLRQAQIKFIEKEFHPYFWASFVVTGKW